MSDKPILDRLMEVVRPEPPTVAQQKAVELLGSLPEEHLTTVTEALLLLREAAQHMFITQDLGTAPEHHAANLAELAYHRGRIQLIETVLQLLFLPTTSPQKQPDQYED